MRARLIVPTVILTLLSAPLGADAGGDSPCVADASLCASLTKGTECRAVGARIVAGSTVYDLGRSGSEAPTFPSQEAENIHFVEATTPTVAPPMTGSSVAVHLGGVESSCSSYDVVEAGRNVRVTKSCGSAKIAEARISLRTRMPNGSPVSVSMDLYDLFYATCSSVEPPRTGGVRGPQEGINEAAYGRVVVNGSAVFDGPIQKDTGTSLAPGTYAFFGERHNPVNTICSANSGDAFRLVTPSLTVMLGWSSTAACD